MWPRHGEGRGARHMEPTVSATVVPSRAAAFQRRSEERRNELAQQLAVTLPPGQPFVWEVGCGHGHFLTAFAHAHPGTVCLGIDIMGDRIDRALRKRERARLNRLFFLQADARLFLEVLPAGNAISQLFVLFPDPWPKLRHHKHRILNDDFLTAAAVHTAPDSRLYFRTDYAPYFEAVRSLISRHSHWQLVSEPWPFEFETVFQARATQHHSLIAQRRVETTATIS